MVFKVIFVRICIPFVIWVWMCAWRRVVMGWHSPCIVLCIPKSSVIIYRWWLVCRLVLALLALIIILFRYESSKIDKRLLRWWFKSSIVRSRFNFVHNIFLCLFPFLNLSLQIRTCLGANCTLSHIFYIYQYQYNIIIIITVKIVID